MGDQDHIGENLRAYMQAFSPAVRDIFERFDFHTQIDRLAKAGLLYLVTEKFANIDLHPTRVSNARMGHVFEELIRRPGVLDPGVNRGLRIVPEELTGANITQDVARVAPASGVHGAWLRWALLSSPVREALASGSLGAAVRGVNIFDLKRASIPTPPLDEQEQIARWITNRVGSIESLRAEAGRAITLLQERRAALVSAAVTMSTQALNSDRIRQRLKDILLTYAGLYESLRDECKGNRCDSL